MESNLNSLNKELKMFFRRRKRQKYLLKLENQHRSNQILLQYIANVALFLIGVGEIVNVKAAVAIGEAVAALSGYMVVRVCA